jgi:hypothetical protein
VSEEEEPRERAANAPPSLNPTEAGIEATWDDFAGLGAARRNVPELFALRDERLRVVLDYADVRSYGLLPLPRTVWAVPVTIGGAVTLLTELDLDAYHERGMRPFVRTIGAPAGLISQKTGNVNVGFHELSHWMSWRGRRVPVSTPAVFASDRSLPDTVRQLLHAADVGPYLKGPRKSRTLDVLLRDDSSNQEYWMTVFDGGNLFIGGPGSGKSFLLASICRSLGVDPIGFSESGDATLLGYPSAFAAMIEDIINSEDSAVDSLRWAARRDNKVLMKNGWSALFYELIAALCQTLERLRKTALLNLNPMGPVADIAAAFRGVASTVVEISPDDNERPYADDDLIMIPVRYATRRVGRRPVLTGHAGVDLADIEYGIETGIISRDEIDEMPADVKEAVQQSAGRQKAVDATASSVNSTGLRR